MIGDPQGLSNGWSFSGSKKSSWKDCILSQLSYTRALLLPLLQNSRAHLVWNLRSFLLSSGVAWGSVPKALEKTYCRFGRCHFWQWFLLKKMQSYYSPPPWENHLVSQSLTMSFLWKNKKKKFTSTPNFDIGLNFKF